MSAATMHVCELCGTEFEPQPGKVGRYCSHDCRNEAYKLTIQPTRDTVRGETAAIVKSETKPIRVKPFTDTEMETESEAIATQRKRDGLPLINETMMGCMEKAGRERAAMAREGHQIVGEARKGAYVQSKALRGKPACLSSSEVEGR